VYCGFFSTTSLSERQRYVDAVCREMTIRSGKHEIQGTQIDTIYLGGGTPSQLSAHQLNQLFDAIYNIYNVSDKAEVTMECNPDDITDVFADMLKQLPVNRVSMGAQTFNNQRLHFLHRRHKAERSGR
jgi:Coproporphyrinogen III oxidase and related Fe-S oxidoreductases